MSEKNFWKDLPLNESNINKINDHLSEIISDCVFIPIKLDALENGNIETEIELENAVKKHIDSGFKIAVRSEVFYIDPPIYNQCWFIAMNLCDNYYWEENNYYDETPDTNFPEGLNSIRKLAAAGLYEYYKKNKKEIEELTVKKTIKLFRENKIRWHETA